MRNCRIRISETENERGVTLLELIMVMVIIGILAGFVSNFVFYEINMYDKLTNQTEGLQISRNALRMMARDIRHIMAADSIFLASDDSIRFDNVDDVTVSYKFTNGQILKNGDPLMNSVDDVQFQYFNSSDTSLPTPVANTSAIRSIGVALITTLDGQSFTLSAKIQPRNF